MDFEVGVYKLGKLKIFWAVLADGTQISEVGDDGLNVLLEEVSNVALRVYLARTLRLYANWLRENVRLTLIIEQEIARAVRTDGALTWEPINRWHPDDLERKIIDGFQP